MTQLHIPGNSKQWLSVMLWLFPGVLGGTVQVPTLRRFLCIPALLETPVFPQLLEFLPGCKVYTWKFLMEQQKVETFAWDDFSKHLHLSLSAFQVLQHGLGNPKLKPSQGLREWDFGFKGFYNGERN